MNMRRIRPAIFAAVAVAAVAGCGKEEMAEVFKKGADSVGQAVSKTTELVKEQAQLAGQFELTLDVPVKAGRCYATLVSLSGRPSVLTMSSCKEAGDESFPSVLLRAEVTAGTLAELSGQKVAAQLYVQTEAEGPVWHSPEGQSVEVSITTAGDGSVEGELLGGTVVRTDTGQSTAVTGKFTGSLR
jgi:hypothetical protein